MHSKNSTDGLARLGINFPIKDCELSATEQKVYLALSLEFQLILDKAPSFQMGAYHWNQILPDRLQKYGLTEEAWEKISNIGDNCEPLQEELAKLVDELEKSQ